MRTRPLVILTARHQPRLNWVPFYVVLNAPEFSARSDEVVIALVLPERRSLAEENMIGGMGREAFQRPKPASRYHVRRNQKVNVVRHDNERMKLVSPEPSFAVSQSFNYEVCNVRSAEKPRTTRCLVQYTVQGHKRSAARQLIRWKNTIGGQAAVQTKSDKQRLTDGIPMGQASFVVLHP